MTVTAKFEKNTYQLIFVVDGETYESLDVLYGEAPDVDDLPGDPEKVGFAFDGWFNGETAFDEEAAITETVTYTAKFTKNAWVVKFVADGTEDKIFYIPMTSGKLAVENIPAKLANTDTAYFLGWYNGTTKAKADLAIAEDVVFTAKFVTADDFTGTHYDLTNYWLFEINGTAVSGVGVSKTATFDASTGILTFTVATRPVDQYEFSFAEDGVSLVVVHKHYDDIEEEVVADDPVALTALPAEGMTGTWRASNSDLYKVENGRITMSGTNKNIYFGIVIADGDGYCLIVKTSSYAKAVEASITVDEKGNWLYTETGKTETRIYVANPVDFIDYYCSETSESVYAFTLADGSFLYVYKSGSTYLYTDFTLVDEGKRIYTFTVGEEVKTVKMIDKEHFAYPGEEKGTYTGALGDMIIDGFGNAKVGDAEYAYTVAGNYFSIDTIGVLKVNFEDKTYTVADNIGYAGTYTVYENFEENGYTLTLNGYGLATLTNAKGVSTVGTYTVADGKLTLSGVESSYNKAWTLTHDGMAMSFSNSYAKYEIVNDAYEPAPINLSDYLGKYYTDGTDTFFFSESEVSYWGDYEFAFWLDATRDFYASAYWDGARLVITDKDYDAGVDGAKDDDVVFLVEFADGKITMTHYCTTGLDMDGYPEQDFKKVTYTVCDKPAVTFPEWALGTWYTSEGAVVVITENTLTVNGAAAKDVNVEIVWGSALYTMTIKSLTYTLTQDYDGNATFGAAEFYEGELPLLLEEAPADADNAFLGAWFGEDDLSLVFANNGTLEFNGISLPYVIKDGKAYFLNSDDETMMTVTISGNTVTVSYTIDDEPRTLTLTKEGTEPEEPVVEHDGFFGEWKDSHSNTLTFTDGKVVYNGGAEMTYVLSADGKKATFSNADFEFTCVLSDDGTTLVATLAEEYEDPFKLTFEKQTSTDSEEPVVENPFVGTWKRKKTGQVIVIAADGTLTYDGTKCDYTLADGTLSFNCGDTDFVFEMSGDVISMVCTYDGSDSYDTAEKVVEEPVVEHDGFYGEWKDSYDNTLTFKDGNKVTYNNGTDVTVLIRFLQTERGQPSRLLYSTSFASLQTTEHR